MRVKIPVVGPSYESRVTKLSAQVTKSLYPSIEPESKSIVSLQRFWGLKSFSSPGGRDRGMHDANGVLYTVSGGTLYSVNSAGTATSLGSIAGTGRCDFANDSSFLVITTGDTAYQYDISGGTLTEITDSDLTDPTTVTYLNSTFIYDNNAGTSGQFVTSDVSDPDSIDGLNFASAESHPDDILRAVTYNQQVYFFGSETLEPWWNSGQGSPPFDRVQGGVRPFGLAGAWALAQDDDQIFFLDNNREPQRLVGLQVEPIGNPTIGKEWRTYSTVSDAIGLTYELDQQRFFELTFPTANRTWVYHQSSGTWFMLGDGVTSSRHRGNSYAFVYGKHLMADHTNGNIYELDPDTFQDNSGVIQIRRATANIHGGLYGAPGSMIHFNRVEFDLQVGVGINTGQGSDPQVMVRYSDDGGHTWSAEIQYPLGAGGDYLRKVVLYQQGRSENRIYELTYSDPTEFAILGGNADIELTDGPR